MPSRTRSSCDPTTHGNNVQLWNMTIIAPKPWYAKRTLVDTWTAHPATVAEHGFDQETIAIANRGQLPQWPLFLVKGPGRAWVQDGMTDRMVQLPTLQDRTATCWWTPTRPARTLTGSHRSGGQHLLQLIRSSPDPGLPAARHQRARAAGVAARQRDPVHQSRSRRARSPTSPCKHSHPEGAITVMIPQRYIRPS